MHWKAVLRNHACEVIWNIQMLRHDKVDYVVLEISAFEIMRESKGDL